LGRAAATLALSLGGVLLLFVAAEQLARMVWTPPLRSSPRPPAPEHAGLEELRSVYALSQPNLRALNGGVLFETNSDGFRGPETPKTKRDGVFRIAVIGDSFTMGWGVRREDAYPARLEAALNGGDGDVRVEVLNFGMAGRDAVASVKRFHDKALAYDPDLVVFGFTVNDLENEHYRRVSVDLETAGLAVSQSRSYLWRIFAPRFASIAEVLWAPAGGYVHELDENYFKNPDAWQAAVGALDELAASARERGFCAVLLIHPRLHFLNVLHPYHRHYEAIAAAAAARGITPIPTIQRFLGEKDRELWVHPGDPHPGVEAHGRIAEALQQGLEALPEACGLSGEPRVALAESAESVSELLSIGCPGSA
jgi:lysophospholipase L1-like esterase